MAISENLETLAGKPVVDWQLDTGIMNPAGTMPRINLSYDDENQKWTDRFAEFLDDPAASEVTGLVIGMWDISFTEGDSSFIVEALVAARDRLPNLTAIFFGDITSEECEISWIRQSDVSPLFDAYPNLEYFGVRGGDGLRLGSPRHERLKTLIVETGGLDASVVRSISTAHLPALEHLELGWDRIIMVPMSPLRILHPFSPATCFRTCVIWDYATVKLRIKSLRQWLKPLL